MWGWLPPLAAWLVSSSASVPAGLLTGLALAIAVLAPAPDFQTGGFVSLAPWGVMIGAGLLTCLLSVLERGPGFIRRALGARLVRREAGRLAKRLDNWALLDGEPEGAVVSVVGWARGHSYLERPLGGRPCLGMALRCRGETEEVRLQRNRWGRQGALVVSRWCSGLYELLHDFDLVDDSGRSIPIKVADGRMLARPNVELHGDDVDARLLIASLDLPLGALPSTRQAFVLHDGDPVLVIGFKSTVVDPSAPGAGPRGAPLRATLVSDSTRPLLVIPIEPV